jgi:fibronectin-binding autotransporter adhesin
LAINGAVTLDTNSVSAFGSLPAGTFWKGGASNLWSGVNWSPDTIGATSSTLLSGADVVFSVTGIQPQNQNTVLDVDGGANGSIVGDVLDNAALVVDRSGTLAMTGSIVGTGSLSQVGPGTLILTGTSTYAGSTTVSAGTLEIDGVLGSTAVTVQNTATLSGQGTIAGGVTIQNGGHLAPGLGAQTLGVGNLSLSSGSILDYVLSTPGVIGGGVNTLVNVGGNLTLAGILNVTNGGSFGAGAYRLINYTGALSGTTLTLGTLPAGFTEVVTTAVPGQVNLVVSASAGPTQFWNGGTTVGDGTVHGGNGTWDNFTTNFTNAGGTGSQSWQNGFAIFSATPGTVTLGDNILFQGMEFATTGYSVAGAGSFTLTATGAAVITSDPGVSATISAPIGGVSGLTKSGSGELILSGTNTYSGGTMVLAGVLSVGSDTNLGNVNGGITLEGGELVTTIDGFTTARTVDVNGSGSPDTLAAAVGTTATYSGVLSDTGALVVGDPTNVGTVVLTGANTYSGGTSLNGGILAVSGDGNLGTGPLRFNGGTLEALAGGGGIISGKAITLLGGGGTFLADASTASTFSTAITGGGTTVSAGAT